MAYPHIQLNNIPLTGIKEAEIKALSLNLFAFFITVGSTTHQVFNEKNRPLYTESLKDMQDIILSIQQIPEDEVYLEQATGLYYQLNCDQQAQKVRIALSS
ncbi:MAG: hypothetical protein KAG18_08615 [Sinobacterium sp.]|nr:hypothetical protein [Sinobacterium sp.]